MSDRSLTPNEEPEGEPGVLMQSGERLIAITDTYVDDTLCVTEFVRSSYGSFAIYDCPLEGRYVGERFCVEVFSTPHDALREWNRMQRKAEHLTPLDVYRGGVSA